LERVVFLKREREVEKRYVFLFFILWLNNESKICCASK